jgi:hypothetical protein
MAPRYEYRYLKRIAYVHIPDVLYHLTAMMNQECVNLQGKSMITQYKCADILSPTVLP